MSKKKSKTSKDIPNEKTLRAIKEAEELMANPNAQKYSLEEALEELKKD